MKTKLKKFKAVKSKRVSKGVYDLEYVLLMFHSARGLVRLDSILDKNFDYFRRIRVGVRLDTIAVRWYKIMVL